MDKKTIERETLDFSSLPNIIRLMIEDNSDAATVIDKLIELKGESNALATLILLDDMNIRGIQLSILYKMCNQDIETFYETVINITKDDIELLNRTSAPLCVYKAIFEGTSEDRKKYPNKYIFTNVERENYTKSKEKNNAVEKDLYPTITIEEALKIIKNKGFKCGYKTEYINDNHIKEVYWIFYNKLGDILYTNSLENKNIFLWKDSKLNVVRSKDNNNINYVIELKDHPFETYDNLLKNSHDKLNDDINSIPIIKTIKGIKYTEKNPNYSSCVTALIYDLLSFEQIYNELDEGLKAIYKPLLEQASDKAYDEIINHLNADDGIEIATNLQNILGFNLSKSKLLAAKDRFCKARGHETNNSKKKFLSRLVSDDPYTKDMNHRIIEVLTKDIETI
ncbi:unknown [Firmicutes bacterium CAG:822]|nr:unknown [Firmicutes bacterium CAG:822]